MAPARQMACDPERLRRGSQADVHFRTPPGRRARRRPAGATETDMTRHVAGIAVLFVALAAAPLWADDWQSTEATRSLLEQMESSRVDAVAVRDPERPERFIAALRLPGQLLVVSAAHPSVDLVAKRVERGDFRDVYMDLQGTPARDSKFFVHDMAADGLSLDGRGDAYDIVYDGPQTLTCDGRWKDAKMKEAEYRDRLWKADARYTRMLGLLVRALGTQTTAR
jgi:hypothetical protein